MYNICFSLSFSVFFPVFFIADVFQSEMWKEFSSVIPPDLDPIASQVQNKKQFSAPKQILPLERILVDLKDGNDGHLLMEFHIFPPTLFRLLFIDNVC